jgi:superfamily I DNA/RNA helicase
VSPNDVQNKSASIGGEVHFIVGRDEHDEAQKIVNYLSDLTNYGHPDILGKVTWDNCMVIANSRHSFNMLIKTLESRGIPYYLHYYHQRLFESQMVRDFITLVKLRLNPEDTYHWRILQESWNIFDHDSITINKVDLELLPKKILLDPEKKLLLDTVVQFVIHNESNLGEGIRQLIRHVEKKWELTNDTIALKELYECLEEWKSYSAIKKETRINTFLNRIEKNLHNSDKTGLGLYTYQASKGMQADVVVIMDMVDRPNMNFQDQERMIHIAVTRARKLLCFSYPKEKEFLGRNEIQRPSQHYDIFKCRLI